eukprot:COSAG04_NODE_147_length_22902_cov_55.666184_21_plen_153_part_00
MLVGGFTFAHLVRKGAAVKEFIRVGKVEVTRAKLEKVIAEEPELREVAQAKLEQKMGRNMIEWAEGQETAPLVGAVGQVLSTMEEGLATGHAFLLGESYTLADVVATAFCGREPPRYHWVAFFRELSNTTVAGRGGVHQGRRALRAARAGVL